MDIENPIFIGDSYKDLITAKNANIACLLIKTDCQLNQILINFLNEKP